MTDGTVRRPALGYVAELGTLYDARNDTFLEQSLLHGEPPEHATKVQYYSTTDTKSSNRERFSTRCRNLNIGHELEASLLAGLTTADGVGEHLHCHHNSKYLVQGALYQTLAVFEENLDFAQPGLTDLIYLDDSTGATATHIVAGIKWGAQTVVCAKRRVQHGEDRETVQRDLDNRLERLRMANTPQDVADTANYEVFVFADVKQPDQPMPKSFIDAFFFLQSQPHLVEAGPEPISYNLIPLSVLKMLGLVRDLTISISAQPSGGIIDQLSQAFEHLQTRPEAESYLNFIRKNRFCVPSEHITAVEQYTLSLRTVEDSLRTDFSAALINLRCGSTDQKQLDKLFSKFEQSNASPRNGHALLHLYAEKVQFVNVITSQGGRYVDYPGPPLDRELALHGDKDVYVMSFNTQVMKDRKSWPAHVNLALELLKDSRRSSVVLIVDNVVNDHAGGILKHAYISHYRQSQVINEDFLALQSFLKSQCLARCDKNRLDAGMREKPVQCRIVKVSCPGLKCPKDVRQWTCARCHTNLEFGFTDKFIYCECGRCEYQNWEFRCNDVGHGPSYEHHNPVMLLQTLKDLRPKEEINILILGETGVGKSTFINAFINYLAHPSLDQALRNDKLEYIIPCSFSTQSTNPEDPMGRLIQTDIKVGSSEDEHDGSKGLSATQKTMVYPILMGSSMIRLIDTPGIGDVRGAEQDKKNMADILSVLRGYERLHCVLVLLKPNNARLGVMFKFCVKELLTHLHRSAAHNMVFGFTNTRGSNYTPGDTFKPLELLLDEYKDKDLGLFKRNVYCFDSESFRYLAAKKKGVDMGHFEDYRRSWINSEQESQRLMSHIRTLQPHEVKRTMGLNETRAIIAQLTKPMAEIAQQIKASIAINADNMQELANTKLSKDDLLKKLNVKKQVLKLITLNQPRTVCANRKCIEFKNDGSKEGVLKTIYKTLCHNPCYLNNVPPEKVGTPEIMQCWAFSGKEHCRGCGHHWQEHLHVLYELKEETQTVKDDSIDVAMRKQENAITLKQRAIENMAKAISEFEQEHRAIQTAAARFSLFLKKHSITYYNDATIEYLDHLIKQELEKVQAGGSSARLKDLERYKMEYAQQVEIFAFNLQAGKGEKLLDADGVQREVQKLYALKHYGKNLRRMRALVEETHDATFREKPYQVKSRRWTMPFVNWCDDIADQHVSTATAPSSLSSKIIIPKQAATRRIGSRPPSMILPEPKIPPSFPTPRPEKPLPMAPAMPPSTPLFPRRTIAIPLTPPTTNDPAELSPTPRGMTMSPLIQPKPRVQIVSLTPPSPGMNNYASPYPRPASPLEQIPFSPEPRPQPQAPPSLAMHQPNLLRRRPTSNIAPIPELNQTNNHSFGQSFYSGSQEEDTSAWTQQQNPWQGNLSANTDPRSAIMTPPPPYSLLSRNGSRTSVNNLGDNNGPNRRSSMRRLMGAFRN